MSKPYQPTPEQIARAEQKRAKRAQLATAGKPKASPVVDDTKGLILPRKWIDLPTPEPLINSMRVKIMTWNVTACSNPRACVPDSPSNDLPSDFPLSSKAVNYSPLVTLKASQREHMIYNEILAHKADIACMQEVDRLEKLLPVLDGAGHKHAYGSGPQKKHGCLIAFNREKFGKVADKVVYYDNEEIRSDGEEHTRIGSSFKTRNIGFMVALKGLEDTALALNKGIIVATTHLFWHPRQAGILVREVVKFRDVIGHKDWPCIISGGSAICFQYRSSLNRNISDFNFGPDDPAYSLLVGDSLLAAQEERIAPSRVVHRSRDPTVPPASKKLPGDDVEGEGGEESDPDRVITNARPARPSDGLLTNSEFATLFANPVHSAYEEGLSKLQTMVPSVPTYGDIVDIDPAHRGANEPQWTSYTHFWKAVLGAIVDESS
ncbi:hypothetical protein HWV62_40224 [Athelia sp. TMB]|nr:hypothetical protein HWV62_40224 [Athelia sp. TMB]